MQSRVVPHPPGPAERRLRCRRRVAEAGRIALVGCRLVRRACRVGDDRAAASGDVSAGGTCELITVEEVAGIVGTAVVAVAPDPSSCVYEIPVTHAIIALTQVVSNGAAATYENFKGNPEAKAVTGLGDDAVWLPAYSAVNVHVLKGDKMLSLAVGELSGVPIDELPSDTSPEQLLDMATKLGVIAVARL